MVLCQSHPRPRCQEHRYLLAGTQTGSVEAVLTLPLPRGPRGLASLLGLPSPGDSPPDAPECSVGHRHSGTALLLLRGDNGPDPPRAAMRCICGTLPTPLPLDATTFQCHNTKPHRLLYKIGWLTWAEYPLVDLNDIFYGNITSSCFFFFLVMDHTFYSFSQRRGEITGST